MKFYLPTICITIAHTVQLHAKCNRHNNFRYRCMPNLIPLFYFYFSLHFVQEPDLALSTKKEQAELLQEVCILPFNISEMEEEKEEKEEKEGGGEQEERRKRGGMKGEGGIME